METITSIQELTLNSLNQMATNIAEVAPKVLFAILILIIGWLVTKVIVFILKRTLKFAKADKLTDIINEKDLFGKTDLKFNVTSVIVGFVKWVMFLVFLIVASDIMNWEIVSIEIGNLLRYLPRLFSAIALFMIGLYIANFIKKAIRGLFESFDLAGDRAISSLVFYVIIITITITALNQAGIDTEIITNNLTIILGALLLTAALGFGFGSRDIIKGLLLSFYSKKNFEVGQTIKLDDISGEIISIDNICVNVKVKENEIVVIPIKELVENRITKKD
ncbi:mechanosensitive ion channel [Sabulilitoribacter multivorans]|uniref:Mechanosensitive ion channel n=1 Tax=Flaviramulus multivorans TaxID=1304750 RepID=A0ABS9IJ84_9FLAO|nr:mechanosensitive ion channel domain-containing protein [Flaviramulus multivorans]MCF7560648.1 mechanosensitive ion channel [Flaviramulus multivorans]